MDATAILVETQDCRGRWDLTPPRPLSTVTMWGQPVTLTEAQTARLLAGETVRFGSDWYDNVRLARPAAPAAPAPVAPRFTCPRCGEHRDTTRRGHCDDCEA